MFVKICGVRTERDIAVAAEAGADAIGLVFGPSARQVDLTTAGRLAASTPDHIAVVGVFGQVAVSDVAALSVAADVDVIQLHGNYPVQAFTDLRSTNLPLWRATDLEPTTDLRVGAFGEEVLLLDAPEAGGGRTWDWNGLRDTAPDGHWILAGGLNDANVQQAIQMTRPWGVDVSSGVESTRGTKDHELIRRFVRRAKDPIQWP